MGLNKIVIKESGKFGSDTKTFRAYCPNENPGRPDEPLGISASTTGNPSWGALRCAAKAFIRYCEPASEIEEIETRIKLKEIADGFWTAELVTNAALSGVERKP